MFCNTLAAFIMWSTILFIIFTTGPLNAQADTIYPSCLESNITWDQSYVTNVIFDVTSPEACQDFCFADNTCLGSTWLTSQSPLFPLGCAFFSNISSEIACENCVSGPRECLCTVAGECQAEENNILDIFHDIKTEAECSEKCHENAECNTYTYFGEENPFRHVCFLFQFCEMFSEDCIDCSTGFSDCDVCGFYDTMPDGSCKRCAEGWSAFENSCYSLLNNNSQHYDDIAVCRSECKALGGLLASIHSEQENNFINLLGGTQSSNFLGGHRIGDKFEWDDKSPFEYTNWRSGFPGDDGCMNMDNKHGGVWVSERCRSGDSNGEWDCVCKKLK